MTDPYSNPFSSNPLITEETPSLSHHVTIEADDYDLSSKPVDTKPVSGNIGSSPNPTPIPQHSPYVNTGVELETLDEPVTTTIMRDLRNIGEKMKQVLYPKGRGDVLRDWDLWGPLFLCLSLAIVLSITAPPDQSVIVFTGVFVIVWCGAAVVTLNAKLLGGAVSFFQAVCVLGYCLFPLVASSLVSLFFRAILIRLPVVLVAYVWSAYASLNFLSGSHFANRRALASYPLFLFYFVLGWVILIS
ncbi:uncharacterized protein VTP21DRAFT_9385 [Calcarisporiella thermophila]|uniref:uncharacterized protein n=1 Tax=Calcarisporiella thermophila TaxID=911321 RepID=UPI0037420CF9